MGNHTSSNKRIAKNTLFLYFRMIVIMLVSLYTSRVVLSILGESDFGIYNIVGGVVILASFINASLSSATQRYMSFSLGKKDGNTNHILACSIYCYIIICGLILLFAETVGLWFVNTKLSIPIDRMNAANIAYQLSIITYLAAILRIPFEALIISHEKMSFYAYLSMIETILKLLVLYLLYLIDGDKLIYYSIFVFIVPLGCNITYQIYCKYKLNYKIEIKKDNDLIKELFAYSSWSMLGSISNVIARQGSNILINIFFGVTLNAAFGLASKVSAAISSLVNSFQVAFRPQIVKLYANNEKERVEQLCFKTSLYSYYLLLIIVIPISFNINFLLDIWLTETPPYTAIFCILLLIHSLIDAIQSPLTYLITATGRIKVYELWLSALLILNLPISYSLLTFGYNAYTIFIVYTSINFITAIIRIIYIKYFLTFPSLLYLKSVVLPAVFISILSIGCGYFINFILLKPLNSIFQSFVSIFSIFICCGILIFILGIRTDERQYLIHTVIKLIKH